MPSFAARSASPLVDSSCFAAFVSFLWFCMLMDPDAFSAVTIGSKEEFNIDLERLRETPVSLSHVPCIVFNQCSLVADPQIDISGDHGLLQIRRINGEATVPFKASSWLFEPGFSGPSCSLKQFE